MTSFPEATDPQPGAVPAFNRQKPCRHGRMLYRGR
jgi:hypothetical protein